MRYLLITTVIQCCLMATDYATFIKSIATSPQVRYFEQLEKTHYALSQAQKGALLPTVDLSLSATKLQQTPTVTFNLPILPTAMTAPMGTRDHFEGALTLTYPLFTGFALTQMADKATLEYEKSQLKTLDSQRTLFIQATQLIATLHTLDAKGEAQHQALETMNLMYKKAKGYYDQGLLAPSELSAIESQKGHLEAEIVQTHYQRQAIALQLCYLSGLEESTITIPSTDIPLKPLDTFTTLALHHREDLASFSKAIMIADQDIKIAQSRFYPSLYLVGALKHQGSTLALDGDGYTNADKSYAGLLASWNLFQGQSDTYRREAALQMAHASSIAFSDYQQRVITEVTTSYLHVTSLKAQLESATKQLRAATEYANLTQGRFDNQLASADEMSRAVTQVANAKAYLATIRYEIFTQTALLWLQCGLEPYRQAFSIP